MLWCKSKPDSSRLHLRAPLSSSPYPFLWHVFHLLNWATKHRSQQHSLLRPSLHLKLIFSQQSCSHIHINTPFRGDGLIIKPDTSSHIKDTWNMFFFVVVVHNINVCHQNKEMNRFWFQAECQF